MARFRVAVLLVATVTALAFAGCRGGTGTLPAMAPAGSHEAPKTARVRLTIKVAIKSNARPRFISPSTKSLKLVVTQSGKTIVNQTANLTPTSTGCSSSLADVTCTLTIALDAGKYLATVSTYDKTGATGKLLSAAQNVSFTVATKGPNVIPLTLSGVPKSLLVARGSGGTYYIEAQDADGNFIIGAGAPKLAAVKTSGANLVSITQPTAASPNRLVLSSPANVVFGTEKIGINASYPAPLSNACAQAGAVCSFPNVISASYQQLLAIANTSNDTLVGYQVPLTKDDPAPLFTQPVNSPYPTLFDANNTLFTASQSANELDVFAPPYTDAPITNAHGLNQPISMALDSSANLFVANQNGTVTEYAKPYTSTPLNTVTNGVIVADTVSLDSSDNLYVGWHSGDLDVYAPPYTGAPTTVTLMSAPNMFLFSGTKLYVGESQGLEVFNLPLTGASTPVASLTNFSGVTGLLLDSSGKLYVSTVYGGDFDSGAVMIFSQPVTSGSSPVSTISLSYSSLFQVGSIAFDAAGNLYVETLAGGAGVGGLFMYSPPFSNASTPTFKIATSAIHDPSRIMSISNAKLQLTP